MLVNRSAMLLCGLLLSSQAFCLQINLNDTGGAAPGSQAGDAFAIAAQFWDSQFSDPITINIDVGFSNLGSGILGQTQSYSQATSYQAIRNALVADASTTNDSTVAANLSVSNYLTFLTNTPNGTLVLDNNQSVNNSALKVNQANLKALGLFGPSSSPDASITFNNQFSYDFDPSNGVASNLFDFVGIAIHEIGHALGFVSGVDFIDYYSGSGPGASAVTTFDFWDIFSVLDLFRFSDRSLSYGPDIQDLAIYDASQYFSVDGGITEIAPFSTGRYNGDGRQASHWENITDIGIMKPTISQGQVGSFTLNDLLAFDSIGFDPVPAEADPTDPTDPNPNPDPTEISIPPSILLFLFGLTYLSLRSKIFLGLKSPAELRSLHAL